MQAQVISQPARDFHGCLEPSSFVLSRPHGTVIAMGTAATFDCANSAAHALRSGKISAIAGALPFDPEHPAALTAPHDLLRYNTPLDPREVALPRLSVTGFAPSPDTHLNRVHAAVRALSSTTLQKVVLARAVELRASSPVDSSALLARLVHSDPNRNGFAINLSAAGGPWQGCHLIGASPEVLISRSGTTITCHPLAGSAPRDRDAELDRAHAANLRASSKDLAEHAFVVDQIRATLTPLCRELRTPRQPTLTSTRELWHLGTPIRGELRSASTTALDLALALHPTPAVCGTPTPAAQAFIRETEGDRGFYAGALGWTDAAGDGEWMVTIRCVTLASDGVTLTAHAGGGIVAESEPHEELDETTSKLRTIFDAFGVEQ
ncbi:isochorismate synthase [Hoyosella subflava]|uniref:isochorismate synthase n=1 Tax=Hoyosella subflava (strain DSM 45089 / JCM 17490 / NBRC 109087 / DQS3-9A1) TaxID=443218 RepID=F6EEE5_HOYSD|nr:isochorismate synthase [Hoyosella subflava]AEF38597.1 Isochorismate synthase [Hoyosella subflava DQS3-9A1]